MSSQVKAPPAPLTERDAQQLIRALGSGDQPKVLVRSDEDGVPAPTRGRLVGYLDGDDAPFQVVLTQDGRERELSVPAAALAVLPRTSAEIIARTASGGTGEEPAATAPAEAGAADTVPSEDKTAEDKDKAPEDKTSEDNTPADKPAESKTDAAPAPAKKAAPRKAARAAGGGNGSGEVTVTVTVTGEATTVEAASGSKKLAKAVTLPVAAGRAMAQALGVEAVTDAVEMLVEEYRLAKEREAEQLRSRLAALEKELAEYAEGTGEQGSPSHS